MSKKIVFAVHAPTDIVISGTVFGSGKDGENTRYFLVQVDPDQLIGIVSRKLTLEDTRRCDRCNQIKETINRINEDYVHNREQKALDNHVGNMFPIAKIEFQAQAA